MGCCGELRLADRPPSSSLNRLTKTCQRAARRTLPQLIGTTETGPAPAGVIMSAANTGRPDSRSVCRFYNSAKTLADAVRSVFAQPIRLELILVDDGSRARIARVAPGLPDPRVRVNQRRRQSRLCAR